METPLWSYDLGKKGLTQRVGMTSVKNSAVKGFRYISQRLLRNLG